MSQNRARTDFRPLLRREKVYEGGRTLLRHLQLQNSTQQQAHSNDVHPESAFAKLPLELREIIWRYALEEPPYARPAHFHVFDRVFDSCTYASPESVWARHQANSRHNTPQISLLLTCRAIYEEAIRHLYENTEFHLVILPGLARPRNRLTNKHGIGSLQDCDDLFRKIQRVKLIIQPGEQAVMTRYAARLKQVLSMLDFPRMLSMDLIFNFRHHTRIHDVTFEYRGPVYEALESYAADICGRLRAGKLRVNLHLLRQEADHTRMQALQQSLGCDNYYPLVSSLAGYRTYPFLPLSARADRWVTHRADLEVDCLRRGLVGSHVAGNTTNRISAREMVVAGTLFGIAVLLFPITLPVAGAIFVRQKIDKGEW